VILNKQEKADAIGAAFGILLWIGGWTAAIIAGFIFSTIAGFLALALALLITGSFILGRI